MSIQSERFQVTVMRVYHQEPQGNKVIEPCAEKRKGLGQDTLQPLADDVAAIVFAQSLPELKKALTISLNRLGFISYNISINRSSPSEFMEKPTFTTWTTSDLDDYVNDKWVSKDPLIRHLTVSKAPLLWHRDAFDNPIHKEYHEYLHFKGIVSGLTLPLPATDGKSSAITLLSIDSEPKSAEVVSTVSILSNVAISRMAAFKEGEFSEFDLRRFNTLSKLQIEILGWIAKGKTNNEIAIIVGRTERTIAYHVSEVLGKLGVVSRVQAAAFYAAMGF